MTTGPLLDDEALLWLGVEGRDRSDLRRDPFPFYDRLRRHARVYEAPDGRWFITGHAEALSFLQNRHGHSHCSAVPSEHETIAHRIFHGSLLFQDPPKHTQLRRSVSAWFSPSGVARLRQRAAQYSRQLLEPLRDADVFDFKNGPSFQLPVLMIADILGLPPEDFEETQAWSKSLIYVGEHPEARGSELDDVNRVARDAVAYFTDAIRERERLPGADLISALVLVPPGGDRATDEEIVAMCVLLHIAGHSTTNDLLANGIFHMTQHPDSLSALRANPDLVASAVEEFLRYDTPAGVTTARLAADGLEVGGAAIPQGAPVHVVSGATGRDPLVFSSPDRFDVSRNDRRHIAFASGNHICLGAHLARVEAQEFLRVLITEFPRFELAASPQDLPWVDSWIHRGLEGLPLSWAR